MTLTHRPIIKANIVEEMVGQELFLYDESRDLAYCINSGAALIWYLCDGMRDMHSIAREISTTFSLPETQVVQEVCRTIGEFQEMGLLAKKMKGLFTEAEKDVKNG